MLKIVLMADKNKSAKQPQNTATQTVNFFEYKKVLAFCFVVFCGSYIDARCMNFASNQFKYRKDFLKSLSLTFHSILMPDLPLMIVVLFAIKK